jgi:hypothetical protein
MCNRASNIEIRCVFLIAFSSSFPPIYIFLLNLFFAESLETKDMGHYKFLLWLQGKDSTHFLSSRNLKECHRQWNVLQQRKLALLEGEEQAKLALELCRSKGLIRATIEECNNFGETPFLAAAATGER